MSWDAVWNVLKWVLLVLAAGFIGQFGKSFAQHLLERRRRAKAGAEPEPDSMDSTPESSEAQTERARIEAVAKIEKKRAKAEVKRLKKQDD